LYAFLLTTSALARFLYAVFLFFRTYILSFGVVDTSWTYCEIQIGQSETEVLLQLWSLWSFWSCMYMTSMFVCNYYCLILLLHCTVLWDFSSNINCITGCLQLLASNYSTKIM